MWLSPEFVAWCKRNGFKPEGLGACIVHTFALKEHGPVNIISHGRPVSVDKIYDLPSEGKEGA